MGQRVASREELKLYEHVKWNLIYVDECKTVLGHRFIISYQQDSYKSSRSKRLHNKIASCKQDLG